VWAEGARRLVSLSRPIQGTAKKRSEINGRVTERIIGFVQLRDELPRIAPRHNDQRCSDKRLRYNNSPELLAIRH